MDALKDLSLCPAGKPGECGQPLYAWLDLAHVDLGSQEGDLVVQTALVDIYEPGLGSAVAAVVPAIAAPLQRVLELERGLLRPDPQRRPAGGLEQKRERRRTGRRQYEVQDSSSAWQSSTARCAWWKKPVPFSR